MPVNGDPPTSSLSPPNTRSDKESAPSPRDMASTTTDSLGASLMPPAARTPFRKFTVEDYGVYDDASVYYSTAERHHNNRSAARTRTYSQNSLARQMERIGLKEPYRRSSHDEVSLAGGRRFLILVEPTLESLKTQEDTDGNMQITIEDHGPKVIMLRTAASNGHNVVDVRGTYMLSNLLQELTLAHEYGRKQVILDEARLNENPTQRLGRMIKTFFWKNLTRRIDASSIEIAAVDPKDWTDDPRPRIYIPHGCPEQLEYYNKVAAAQPELRLDVVSLPKDITPDLVRDMNTKPGLLAVDMEQVVDPETGEKKLQGRPFVVPGGRFNELYGWDSYMISLGLLVNGEIGLAKSMVLNFAFCIKHYGKILNATRSYYLCRSQPPFLTDMALRVYENIKHEPDAKEFLRTAILAAIKEYRTVWMAEPRLDPVTGLSRYRPEGRGVPPETEAGHFQHILEPYCKKHGLEFAAFVDAYNYGRVHEPELDEYFMHDRAIRESGHDTTYRFEGVCADLATIDLNSLLFKYEVDLARVIRSEFNDKLVIPAEWCAGSMVPGYAETSAGFDRQWRRRKLAANKYLWNEEAGMFFDYNTVTKQQCTYESATTFWSLYSGLASPSQAQKLVDKALPMFEELGGLVSGTEKSRGELGLDRPTRQWDFPFGWAPQQMLAWTGLHRYGFGDEAERLAYRWLFMMTKAFFDYNGVVVEKYDVTRPIDPHRVDAEYGNQGLDFQGIAKEGFGWVNASYVYGMHLLSAHMRRALGTLTPWDTFEKALKAADGKQYQTLAEMEMA